MIGDRTVAPCSEFVSGVISRAWVKRKRLRFRAAQASTSRGAAIKTPVGSFDHFVSGRAPAIRGPEVCGMSQRWRLSSLGLDVAGADHLGPLFGFVGDKLTEVAGRARKYAAAEAGKPRAHLG